MAAVAVAPRTDRNHTVDASPTLMPLLFKTLKKKIHLSLSIILLLITHLVAEQDLLSARYKIEGDVHVYQMLANN